MLFPVLAEARRPATRQRGGASHPQVARTPSDASDLLVRLEDVRRLRQRAAAPRGEARASAKTARRAVAARPVASARSETLVDKARCARALPSSCPPRSRSPPRRRLRGPEQEGQLPGRVRRHDEADGGAEVRPPSPWPRRPAPPSSPIRCARVMRQQLASPPFRSSRPSP